MAELIETCPRCSASKVTFDVLGAIPLKPRYTWQERYEVFCQCRNCSVSTVFQIAHSINADYDFAKTTGLFKLTASLNNWFEIQGYISLKDRQPIQPPEFLPQNIARAFKEGATCIAVGCSNAAGTMFRLCVDMATKDKLPPLEPLLPGLNNRTRRDLGLRLPWLFDNGLLPEALRELSHSIKEDGNDGAHAGTLTTDEAKDILEFTTLLLDRIYSEPERLKAAAERREERRNAAAAAAK